MNRNPLTKDVLEFNFNFEITLYEIGTVSYHDLVGRFYFRKSSKLAQFETIRLKVLKKYVAFEKSEAQCRYQHTCRQ